MQINSGFRSILASPFVYSTLQKFMGAERVRKWLADNYICPYYGMNVLDVGCGPCDILAHLPNVSYWGYDISEYYINQAKASFGDRGRFICKALTRHDLEIMPEFDVVILLGVLHHLCDEEANELISLSHDALKKGGKLITLDACYVVGQNPIAKFLISKDRGQNIRDVDGYESLVTGLFEKNVITKTVHHVWIPYTHCLMVCQI